MLASSISIFSSRHFLAVFTLSKLTLLHVCLSYKIHVAAEIEMIIASDLRFTIHDSGMRHPAEPASRSPCGAVKWEICFWPRRPKVLGLVEISPPSPTFFAAEARMT